MAQFNTVGIDAIIKEVNKRSKKAVEKIPKMLEAGAAVLIKAQQAEVDTMIAESKIRDLGVPTRSLDELRKAIGATPIKEEDGSKVVYIYPQGKDSKGVRNAEKGFQLEYGNSHFDGYPWMQTANDKAAEAVTEAQREIWEADE